ncbi:hypothetical protein DOTSEDRAFT_28881 [Dothistroma septosporum NZE10]|uniref:Uncharacterized protein n=1 Tax=Dothistroma septosporum (strain NZE10 / CBS 128990) TaxID=675120 RepID=M2XZZ3_DOTSN|nr:hypothetical protein DOTSEDRAFT_28881 [Dothistroma septosporum NZE10]
MSVRNYSAETARDTTTADAVYGVTEKLNALAGDDGSRGDIGHLQMPKLLQLVGKMDEDNTDVRKIEFASAPTSSSRMFDFSGPGSISGGKVTATQMQAVLECLDKLTERS